MLIQKIVARVNGKLAGEHLSYDQLIDFLDDTIDDINVNLGSTFPVFSELEPGIIEYNYFPDRYIRQVVCHGAVHYYYTMDEEGFQTATEYKEKYQREMFLMIRDYLSQVPVEYRKGYDQALIDAGEPVPDVQHGVLQKPADYQVTDGGGVKIYGNPWKL